DAQCSRGDRRRDLHIGQIGDRMKRDAASTERSEKRTRHEQPKRARAHGLAARPTAFGHKFFPLLSWQCRAIIVRYERMPIRSEAEIFRLPAQKNRAGYHDEN